MKRSDLIADMRRFVGGGGFITRKSLADYLGYKDPHCVDKYLIGLDKVGGRYFFIPDVATVLKGGELA